MTTKTNDSCGVEEATDIHLLENEWKLKIITRWSQQQHVLWLVTGGNTTQHWAGRGGAKNQLTHSPFTFSVHSRGERKELIQLHLHTPAGFRRMEHSLRNKNKQDDVSTHHDDVSRLDTDFIVTTSIKWIQSSVVDHLHWMLLLIEATGWCFLLKQTGNWTFLHCKLKKEKLQF